MTCLEEESHTGINNIQKRYKNESKKFSQKIMRALQDN